ncbi:hypothetical protein LTR84_010591 [Exophiala bonariae]|uniref:Uncharacterized protein n=1 Tax=Exophiala bonariae TaxID=1690606 RepID=A0AAV9MTH5_9EURO|nr:hypothetical protein LTR84_010591 [Exophiala bonariae]
MWVEDDLPLNSADGVGRIGLEIAGNPDTNDEALYVAGGKAVGIDEVINNLQPQWPGNQSALDLARGQKESRTGKQVDAKSVVQN